MNTSQLGIMKNSVLLHCVIISLFVSTARTATTYYEIWRSTTNNPSTATPVERWYTSPSSQPSYEDTSVTPGHYYYWIRALACESSDGYHYAAQKGWEATSKIICPIKTTRNRNTPVLCRLNLRRYGDVLFSGNGKFYIEEYDPAWFPDEIDSWVSPIQWGTQGGYSYEMKWPEIPEMSRDVNITPFMDFGEAEVYLKIQYYENVDSIGYWVATDIINVTIQDTPPVGPLSSATQGTHPDKIVVTWNATTNVCSEIDNTPSCEGWTQEGGATRSLYIEKSGNGRVRVNGDIKTLPWSGSYEKGTSVSLQAVPDSNWTFGYWSGSVSSYSQTISVTLNNSANITANFLDLSSIPTVEMTLSPSADTYVSSKDSNQAKGTSVLLVVGRSDYYGDGTVIENTRSLLRFNLSDISQNTTVIDADLFLTGWAGKGTVNVGLQGISQSWSESSVTWNTQPSVYSSPVYYINWTAPQSTTTQIINVKGFIQDLITNNKAQYGFRLSYADGTTVGNYVDFRSKEDSPTSERPKLWLKVNESITAPTSLSGPTQGGQGDSLSFTSSGASSNLGHTLQYKFDWGDGTQSGWSSSASRSKTYTTVGQYGIRVQARCSTHTDAISNWSPVLKTVTITASTCGISGYVHDPNNNGISGVTVSANNGGGSVTTDSSGYYSFTVPYNWSGTVMPNRIEYSFIPAYLTYSNVTSNQTNQNYIGTLKTFTISGRVLDADSNGVSDVTLIVERTFQSTTTDSEGFYILSIPYGWSGKIVPGKTGYEFSPSYEQYTNVISNLITNYSAVVLPQPDITGDGDVNLLDFSLLANLWMAFNCNNSNNWCEGADINRSGSVGVEALLIMAEHWLEEWGCRMEWDRQILNRSFEIPDPSRATQWFTPPMDWDTFNYAGLHSVFIPQPEYGQVVNWTIPAAYAGQYFLLLSTGDVQGPGSDPMITYSSIEQVITVFPGDVLYGNYLFGTCDYRPYNDTGLIKLIPVDPNDGLQPILLVSVSIDELYNFQFTNGWQQFSYTFTDATCGKYYLYCEVRDIFDTRYQSYLALDNFRICRNMPEKRPVY